MKKLKSFLLTINYTHNRTGICFEGNHTIDIVCLTIPACLYTN